jgi:hypothetical protein
VNPRLQVRDRAAFVELMRSLNLGMPTHVTEALRTNMSGGKTIAQMLADAASNVPFMALAELSSRLEAAPQELIVLDVRERDAYEQGHIPGAVLLSRGQLNCVSTRTYPIQRAASWCVVNSGEYRRLRQRHCAKGDSGVLSPWMAV